MPWFMRSHSHNKSREEERKRERGERENRKRDGEYKDPDKDGTQTLVGNYWSSVMKNFPDFQKASGQH